MFRLIIELLSTYMQLMYLVAGSVCWGIGVLVLGYGAWVRIRERTYTGEVVALRKDGDSYWPVLAYTDAQGTRHEALSSTGSSGILDRAPGTKVRLLADPASPSAPMMMRDWWVLVAIGLFPLGVGYPFVHMGLRDLHFTWMTFAVGAAISAWFSIKIFRFVHPLLDARKSGASVLAQRAFLQAKLQARENLPLVSAGDVQAAVKVQTLRTASTRPFFTALGLALLLGGAIWLEREIDFLAHAAPAPGVVVRNDMSEGGGSSSSSYHAVVAFTGPDGRVVLYRDTVGTSPPWYRAGDNVRILYLPAEPSSIMIDRGVWNWLVQLAMVAIGALMFGAGALHYLRDRSRPAAQPLPQ